MSFSSNFLGSVLGKQSFFGKQQVGTNIYKNISFGFCQSLASISLAIFIVYLAGSNLNLAHFGFSPFEINESLIVVFVAAFSVSFYLIFRNQIKIRDFKVLALAYLRSIIYYIQYLLVISFFYDANQILIAISIVAVYFLLKTIIPFMNIFGGIGTRELTLSIIFSSAGLDGSYIVLGALLIWITNFIFPNILGIISICKKRHCLAHSSL